MCGEGGGIVGAGRFAGVEAVAGVEREGAGEWLEGDGGGKGG